MGIEQLECFIFEHEDSPRQADYAEEYAQRQGYPQVEVMDEPAHLTLLDYR